MDATTEITPPIIDNCKYLTPAERWEHMATQARIRSAKRHNRHVLQNLRRDRRQTAFCKGVIAVAVVAGCVALSKLLLVAFG